MNISIVLTHLKEALGGYAYCFVVLTQNKAIRNYIFTWIDMPVLLQASCLQASRHEVN